MRIDHFNNSIDQKKKATHKSQFTSSVVDFIKLYLDPPDPEICPNLDPDPSLPFHTETLPIQVPVPVHINLRKKCEKYFFKTLF